MRPERHVPLTSRMEEAVRELKTLITARFPPAAFVVEEGCDPEGIYLVTTVDIADTDEVLAVVGDRLVELQVDEGLPVYVSCDRLSVSSLSFGSGRQPRRRHHCRSHEATSARPGFLVTQRLTPLAPAASGGSVVPRFPPASTSPFSFR